MFDFPTVFVDIETTGGNYRSSRIIEIALLRVENGTITDEFTSFVNPATRLPEFITNLTGITYTDLEDAPFFEDIAYDISCFLKDAVFVAHNVQFDYSFVKRQLEGCGYELSPKRLCTVRLSRALYPQHKGHSLQKIITRHNIQTGSRHRAYDDAKATLEFVKIARAEHGLELFQKAVQQQLSRFSLPPNLDEAYLSGVSNTPGVYIFEDDAGKPIYIGKSVSLRKRILSHFTSAAQFEKEMKISLHTHRLRTIETSTEIEALLLESQLVKEYLPLYNRQLRRIKKQTVLHKSLDVQGYATINFAEQDMADLNAGPSIYGVFKTRSQAKNALENVQKTFDLCPKLLGLEKTSGACFKSQLKKCHGACTGKEQVVSYNERFEIAMERLKLETWPYKDPIIIKLSDTRGLIVDNWNVAGYYVEEPDSEPYIEKIERTFDMDTYRILRSFIRTRPTIQVFDKSLLAA